MKAKIIEFKALGDERGELVAVESEQSIPFPIQRVYYIYGTAKGVERGFHAHKALQQVAVAVSGYCEMILNDGDSTVIVTLDSPGKGVLIEAKVWHYMKNFSSDCILLVFADKHYDESDYLRKYEDFKQFISQSK